ncbi:NtaA/DmoA family FMN-dependent monooxygenase [Streptomyces wuyuanensis]|uniref:NtaA/DmoA family FMN-dependent monooxygenase n=1 Tax=Streptomyces wuyuanensis TaxID=1196353 RepID=UPI003432DE12
MTERRKQIHLAAHFPGVDDSSVRADPRAGGRAAFSSFEHLARTAERGLFDFVSLAEVPRPRHHQGRIHDLDAMGGPEPISVLCALAAVTDRVGLAATVDAAFGEPYEPARRLASLDHLSAGRAAWTVVTSSDALTGENLRRGGCPERPDRAARAAEFVQSARELWGSWTPDGVPRPCAHRGRYFSVEGEFTVPRSPQGRPVVIQAGDSDEGRELAAASADVVLARHDGIEAGRAFCADVKGRLAAYGRSPDDLKIMAAVTVVLGDTDAEAREKAAGIRSRRIPPRGAIVAPEEGRRRDRSARDPGGPLPGIGPVQGSGPDGGRFGTGGPPAVAAKGRAPEDAAPPSIRQAVPAGTERPFVIGTPSGVAAALDAFVRSGAADGFVLVPHPAPGALDDFVDRVVPLLQERGALRTAYAGTTLRSHLGLGEPDFGLGKPEGEG